MIVFSVTRPQSGQRLGRADIRTPYLTPRPGLTLQVPEPQVVSWYVAFLPLRYFVHPQGHVGDSGDAGLK